MILNLVSSKNSILSNNVIMIDWEDFDLHEFDEEEERIRQERLRHEEEQQKNQRY